MKTHSPKKKEIKRDWYLIDAKGKILGRMASRIVHLLMGKQKANFAYHLDVGDYVVVTNAARVKTTGAKLKQKLYQRHTGYPGGLKEEKLGDLLKRKPEQVIIKAVSGMLPKNKLRKNRLKRLKVFSQDHPYQEKKLIEIK